MRNMLHKSIQILIVELTEVMTEVLYFLSQEKFNPSMLHPCLQKSFPGVSFEASVVSCENKHFDTPHSQHLPVPTFHRKMGRIKIERPSEMNREFHKPRIKRENFIKYSCHTCRACTGQFWSGKFRPRGHLLNLRLRIDERSLGGIPRRRAATWRYTP